MKPLNSTLLEAASYLKALAASPSLVLKFDSLKIPIMFTSCWAPRYLVKTVANFAQNVTHTMDSKMAISQKLLGPQRPNFGSVH